MLQGTFDQDCQSVDAFTEVDDIPAQIHSGQRVRGSHHSTAAAARSTVVNDPASTEPANATDTPFGN